MIRAKLRTHMPYHHVLRRVPKLVRARALGVNRIPWPYKHSGYRPATDFILFSSQAYAARNLLRQLRRGRYTQCPELRWDGRFCLHGGSNVKSMLKLSFRSADFSCRCRQLNPHPHFCPSVVYTTWRIGTSGRRQQTDILVSWVLV